MTSLIIDTSTERLLVARRTDEEESFLNVDAEGNHAKILVPYVQEILGDHRPDVIGISLGPGSFTGVRIGLATAKGLAAGWRIPLVGLDNLRAMADTTFRLYPEEDGLVAPFIDARKKKFYGALYSRTSTVITPSDWGSETWMASIRSAHEGRVLVSGYQGEMISELWDRAMPETWVVRRLDDWSVALLDQADRERALKNFLSEETGPRYLRLSEAEEVRLGRST